MNSSRLVLKNLPPKVTEQKLRELFSQKGTVTDVQLKYAKDGKFRHFGFIGFKTVEEAENAQKYFDNSFVGQVKITVESCIDLGDPTNSRRIVKERGLIERQKEEKPKKENTHIQEILDKAKNDPKFAEYLEVHKKNAKAVWENDANILNAKEVVRMLPLPVHTAPIVSEETGETKSVSDLDYLRTKMGGVPKSKKFSDDEGIGSDSEKKKGVETKKASKELFTLKVRGLPFTAKKKDVKQFFKPVKLKSIRLPPKVKGVAYVGVLTEKEFKQALNKNRSILNGNRITVAKYEKANGDQVGYQKIENEPEWIGKEKALEKEESVGESGRIFLRNLCYDATEEDIQKLFESHGTVTEVHLPIDKYTRKVKGFATVSFLLPEHAVAAFSALDGTVFQGRMLHLLPAKAKEEHDEDSGPKNFKEKKEKALKKTAASTHNWNTLFLNQSAIAEVLATRYGLSKEEVLESSGQHSVAVRLALGETQIVNEMKQFLEESGVVLDAFNRPAAERSKSVLLVKNLPFGTTENEMQEIFGKHGEVGRLLLPPYGVSAIVEYLNQTEAKLAFRRLAYTRFKNTPLYLEWAPVDALKEGPKRESSSAAGGKSTKLKTSSDNLATERDETPVTEERPDEESGEGELGSTLFVKNLNFNATEGQLKSHFEKCGKIVSATIATKKDPKLPGKNLSMGYGFITFSKKAEADQALKILQRTMLEGHALELKRSNRTVESTATVSRASNAVGNQTSSKILVRNVPFEATQKEIQDLFTPFGEIKALRLPKKMSGTGTHRGFAFVEYLSKQDSKRAFESLCQSTHLYGRRLVLEWAAAEDSVDELRQKTAAKFQPEGPKRKKMKLSDNNLQGVLGEE